MRNVVLSFEDAFVVQCRIEGFCGSEKGGRWVVGVVEREVVAGEELIE